MLGKYMQSQFIVVSLKEGMFNNANVLFRTKFVDGVSTVTRNIGAGAGRCMPLRGLHIGCLPRFRHHAAPCASPDFMQRRNTCRRRCALLP